MTTAEQMAIAVLKGEMDTARILAAMLLDNAPLDATQQPAIKGRLTVNRGKLRVVLFAKDGDVTWNYEETQREVRNWLDGRSSCLCLHGIDRIEFYELAD